MATRDMAGHERDRGREADKPTQIPARGWKDIALRVKDEATKDNLSMVAGGVAFYSLLALPAGLAALVSTYGLVASPATVERQMGALTGFLPGEARDLFAQQMHNIVSSSEGALGLSLLIAVVLAVWSAAKGMKALMTAMNIAYGEEEKRGFLRLNAVALALTVGFVGFMIVALMVVAGVPAVIDKLGLPGGLRWTIQLARWPLLFILATIALGVLYRYAPSRDEPRWQWVSPGALIGTSLWILGSIAFSIYVSQFGDYNKTYGTLSAVVVLMMWLFISAYAVMIGAEVNSEMERQTARDTTDGAEKPLGSRGAYSADTVGERKG